MGHFMLDFYTIHKELLLFKRTNHLSLVRHAKSPFLTKMYARLPILHLLLMPWTFHFNKPFAILDFSSFKDGHSSTEA